LRTAAELITLSEYKRFGRNVYRISRLGDRPLAAHVLRWLVIAQRDEL
jgi:hypothetical protein